MNCNEFEGRMQRLIDEGLSLIHDDQLSSHAASCPQCDQQIRLWQQIDSVLLDVPCVPEVKLRPLATGGRAAASILSAVAAVLLLVFLLPHPEGEQIAKTTALAQREPDEELAALVDPADWWRNMRAKDWIGQTMPAVHSVRDGVAPLGRSLLQAVAILTTGAGESTS
jgi:hypothetical protein